MQAKSIRRRDLMANSLLVALAMVLISGGGPPEDLAHCGAVSSGGVVMDNGSAMIVGQTVVGIASSANYQVRFGTIHCLRAGATTPPPCPADLNSDGEVGPADLAGLLASWGPCANPDDCPADLNGDDEVGPFDLATLLAAWGPCT